MSWKGWKVVKLDKKVDPIGFGNELPTVLEQTFEKLSRQKLVKYTIFPAAILTCKRRFM